MAADAIIATSQSLLQEVPAQPECSTDPEDGKLLNSLFFPQRMASGHLLGRGAEAVITLENHDGRRRVKKERLAKGYRQPQLDAELRRSRTRREAKLLAKLPIPGPKLIMTDRKSIIMMEYIEGVQVKECLDNDPGLARTIGQHVARLHDAGIIHGDLTTSNMILKEGGLFFIDFGLGFTRHPERRQGGRPPPLQAGLGEQAL